MTQEIAINFNHLCILESFQKITGCNSIYLAAKLLEWFPQYRDLESSEAEEIVISGIYMLRCNDD